MNIAGTTSTSKPSAFGMGLIALDLVISADATAPINYWAGGTCGNVLAILSFLGWDSFPIASLDTSSASSRVKNDLFSCGVRLDFAELPPTITTPIIVQEILKNGDGNSTHKFSWFCPKCGAPLPNYKPVAPASALNVTEQIVNPNVFFFDRVSSSALMLARKCRELGAVVIFEPSIEGDIESFNEAKSLAHIIKYSSDRFPSLRDASILPSCFLEIQTLGEDGLIFRSKANNGDFSWTNLPSVLTNQVIDSCGCGDWTTAGLISKLCYTGSHGLTNKSLLDVISALNYGQSLAAWNCGFEGARGGMYLTNSETFHRDIEQIIENKKFSSPKPRPSELYNCEVKLCPACET